MNHSSCHQVQSSTEYTRPDGKMDFDHKSTGVKRRRGAKCYNTEDSLVFILSPQKIATFQINQLKTLKEKKKYPYCTL
jgi:hypothetical protein